MSPINAQEHGVSKELSFALFGLTVQGCSSRICDPNKLTFSIQLVHNGTLSLRPIYNADILWGQNKVITEAFLIQSLYCASVAVSCIVHRYMASAIHQKEF